jgi:hypothetical protein
MLVDLAMGAHEFVVHLSKADWVDDGKIGDGES